MQVHPCLAVPPGQEQRVWKRTALPPVSWNGTGLCRAQLELARMSH